MELFKDNTRTFAKRETAIQKLEKAGALNERWIIAINSEGRYFPVVFAEDASNMHYYINKGICVYVA